MKRLFAIVTMFAIVALTGCKKDEVDDSDVLNPDAVGIVFEDGNFEQALIGSGVDTDKDGCISEEEALAVTEINVINKGIKSLVGLDYFVNLMVLRCSDNADLAEIAQFTNTALIEIECDNTAVEDLDVCLCPDLKTYCANTVSSTFVKDSEQESSIKSGDLFVDTNHEFIIGSDDYKFSDANLRIALLSENNTIDQDKNGKISKYEVRTAKSIDISADVMSTVTKSLILDATRATTVATTGAGFVRNMTSIADFVALESLNADNNVGLSYINLSNNPKLKSALINSVSIAVLSDDQYADGTFKGAVEEGASGETQVVSVSHEVQISNRDIKEALQKSYAGDTGVLTYGDAAKATELSLNKVSVMNIESGILCLPSLSTLSLTECTSITTLDTSSAGELSKLDVSGIATLESVDLTASAKVAVLNVSATKVTDVATTVLPDLKALDISDTAVSTLDLTSNSSLTTLSIAGSDLTKLDVSSCADAITVAGDDKDTSKLEEVVLSDAQIGTGTTVNDLSLIVAKDGGVIYSSSEDSTAERVYPGNNDDVYFEDTNLEKAIIAEYNKDNSGSEITDHITYGQAEAMTTLEITDGSFDTPLENSDETNDFSNIKPLKNFTGLKELALLTHSEKAAELDLTKLTELEDLTLLFKHQYSALRELDFSFGLVKPESGPTPVAKLKSLTLGSATLESLVGTEFISGLTNLNLYGLTKLKDEHITISELKGLTELDLSYCSGITAVDLEGLASLKTLKLSNTYLSSVDLATNVNLEELDLSSMKELTTVDLSTNKKLKKINVCGSGITILDLTGCASSISPADVTTKIEGENAVASKLLTIKLTKDQYTDDVAIKKAWDALLATNNLGIYVGGADDDAIDFTGNEYFKTYLTTVAKVGTNSNGDITYGDAKAYTGAIALKTANYANSSSITSLAQLKYFPNITTLDLTNASNKSLTDLDLTYNTSLTSVLINRNNLTGTVKLPGGGIQECTSVTAMYIQDIPALVNIDLMKYPKLAALYVGSSYMESLVIPASVTKLYMPNGTHPDFTTVDLSENTSMTLLSITTNANYMKTLDISATQVSAVSTSMIVTCELPDLEKLTLSSDQSGEGNANLPAWTTIFSETYATNPFFVIYVGSDQVSTDPEIELSDSVLNAAAIADASINTDGNKVLTSNELRDFTGTLTVPDKVTSLSDLQYFTSLTGINLDACSTISSVNLSEYKTLTSISAKNDATMKLVIPTTTETLAIGGGLAELDLSDTAMLCDDVTLSTDSEASSLTSLTLNEAQAVVGETYETYDTLIQWADGIMLASDGSEISVETATVGTLIYSYKSKGNVAYRGAKPADAIDFVDTNLETYIFSVKDETGAAGDGVAGKKTMINTDEDYYISESEAKTYKGALVIPASVTSLSDLTYFTAITSIDLTAYAGTSVDLSANVALTAVTAGNTNLASITLPDSATSLNLTGSSVAILDISNTGITTASSLKATGITSLTLPAGAGDADAWKSVLSADGYATITIGTETTKYEKGEAVTDSDNIEFVDETYFKDYLVNTAKVDTSGDDEISYAEAAKYTGAITLNTTTYASSSYVTSLAEVKYFPNISSISISNASNTELTDLDLTYNTAVTSIQINRSNLTGKVILPGAGITECPEMTAAYIQTVPALVDIDMTNCTKLGTLYVGSTYMKSLKIPSTLTKLYISNGSHADFETVDLSANTSMTVLSIGAENYMKTLDISTTALTAVTTSVILSASLPSLTDLVMSEDQWALGSSAWLNDVGFKKYATNANFKIWTVDSNGENKKVVYGEGAAALDYGFADEAFMAALKAADLAAEGDGVVTELELTAMTSISVDCDTYKLDNTNFNTDLKVCTALSSLTLTNNATILTTLDISSTSIADKDGVSVEDNSLTSLTLTEAQLGEGVTDGGWDAYMVKATGSKVVAGSTTYEYKTADGSWASAGPGEVDSDGNIVFADAAFQTLMAGYVTHTDSNTSKITVEEAKTYKGEVKITSAMSIVGIEYFTGITSFTTTATIDTDIDLADNVKLSSITLKQEWTSTARSITLPGKDSDDTYALTTLSVVNSGYTSLDASGRTKLKTLTCGGPGLTSPINVTGCTALTTLTHSGGTGVLTDDTKLDLSTNTELVTLSFASTNNYFSRYTEVDIRNTNVTASSFVAQGSYTTLADTYGTDKLPYLEKLVMDDDQYTGNSATWYGQIPTENVNGDTVVIEVHYEDGSVKTFNSTGSETVTGAISITDSAFKTYLLDLNGLDGNGDDDADGTITETEAKNYTDKIEIPANVSDLTGLEYFTGITEIDLSNYAGSDTTIDLSANVALTTVTASVSTLTGLTFDEDGSEIESLDISGSYFSELDLTEFDSLTTLDIENTSITELDLSYTAIVAVDSVTATGLTSLTLNSTQAADLTAAQSWTGKLSTEEDAKIIVTGETEVSYTWDGSNLVKDIEGKITFADPAFGTYITATAMPSYYDDSAITEQEAADYSEALTIPDGVKELTDLEHFTGVTEIEFPSSFTTMTSLELSEYDGEELVEGDIPALTTITVASASVTSIDVPSTTTSLTLTGSGITTLDLSGTSLKDADVANIKVTGLTSLTLPATGTTAEVWKDKLTTSAIATITIDETTTKYEGGSALKDDDYIVFDKDVTGENEISYFEDYLVTKAGVGTEDGITYAQAEAYEGEITLKTATYANSSSIKSLDQIKYFPNITGIAITNVSSSVTDLDLTYNTKLKSCQINKSSLTGKVILPGAEAGTESITAMFIQGIPALVDIDLTMYPNLYNLSCGGTKMESLDLTGCTKLGLFSISSGSAEKFEEITGLSDCTALTSLTLTGTNYINSIDISNIPGLTSSKVFFATTGQWGTNGVFPKLAEFVMSETQWGTDGANKEAWLAVFNIGTYVTYDDFKVYTVDSNGDNKTLVYSKGTELVEFTNNDLETYMAGLVEDNVSEDIKDANTTTVTVAEAAALTAAVVIGENVTDLTGLEAFTSVAAITIASGNTMTTVDLSPYTWLTDVTVASTSIETLTLPEPTLTTLNITGSGIEVLDLSKTTVTTFSATDDKLTSLTLPSNTAFDSLADTWKNALADGASLVIGSDTYTWNNSDSSFGSAVATGAISFKSASFKNYLLAVTSIDGDGSTLSTAISGTTEAGTATPKGEDANAGKIDSNKDGEITVDEAKLYTGTIALKANEGDTYYWANTSSITTLEDLVNFPNITGLDISGCADITTLDISNYSNLTSLTCGGLSSLTLNSALANLTISSACTFETFDISETAITYDTFSCGSYLADLTSFTISPTQLAQSTANGWAATKLGLEQGDVLCVKSGDTVTKYNYEGTESYTFADAAFEKYLLTDGTLGADKVIIESELTNLTSIDIDCDDFAISNVSDTFKFNSDLANCTGLTSLTLTNSTITTLDLSNCSSIATVVVTDSSSANTLTSLTLPATYTASAWGDSMVAATGSSITVGGKEYVYTPAVDAGGEATWEEAVENPAIDGCVVVTEANKDLLTWMKSSSSYSSKFDGDGINSMTTTTADGITSLAATADATLIGDLDFGDFKNLGTITFTNCTGITSMDLSANSLLTTIGISGCSGLTSTLRSDNNYEAALIFPETNIINDATLQNTTIAEFDFSSFTALKTLSIGGATLVTVGNLVESCDDTLTTLKLQGWGNSAEGEFNFYGLTNLESFSMTKWQYVTSLWLPESDDLSTVTLTFDTTSATAAAASKITELVLPYSQIQTDGLYDTVEEITTVVNSAMDLDAECKVYVSEDGENKTQILTYTTGAATTPTEGTSSTPAALYAAAIGGGSDTEITLDSNFAACLTDGASIDTVGEAAEYSETTIVISSNVTTLSDLKYFTGVTTLDLSACEMTEVDLCEFDWLTTITTGISASIETLDISGTDIEVGNVTNGSASLDELVIDSDQLGENLQAWGGFVNTDGGEILVVTGDESYDTYTYQETEWAKFVDDGTVEDTSAVINFDTNTAFETYALGLLSKSSGDTITENEAAAYVGAFAPDATVTAINDFIGYFTGITSLDTSNGGYSDAKLDLSKNVEITTIKLKETWVYVGSEIVFPGVNSDGEYALETLTAVNNDYKSYDLTGRTNLTTITCGGTTKLESLLITGCTNLTTLTVKGTSTNCTSIDFTGLEKLTTLSFASANNFRTYITSLDLTYTGVTLDKFATINTAASTDTDNYNTCSLPNLATLRLTYDQAGGTTSNVSDWGALLPSSAVIKVENEDGEGVTLYGVDGVAYEDETDIIAFNDTYFEAYALTLGIDVNEDNKISMQEAASYAGTINTTSSPYTSIVDMTALQYFTNVTSVQSTSGNITSMVFPSTTTLTSAWVQSTKVASLDFSGCTNLNTLFVGSSSLTSLDLTGTKLGNKLSLIASSGLTELDLSTVTGFTSSTTISASAATMGITTLTLTTAQCTTLGLTTDTDAGLTACLTKFGATAVDGSKVVISDGNTYTYSTTTSTWSSDAE